MKWGPLKAKYYIFVWDGVGGGGWRGCLFVFFNPGVCVCVCSNIFSETTGPIEAKFHVEPPWDRRRKFIQMVIIVNLRGGGGDFLQGCYP